MFKGPALDPVALRMARETAFDYGYCKFILDAWRGDEAVALGRG